MTLAGAARYPRRSSYVCRLILAKILLEMVGAISCTRHNDGYWNGMVFMTAALCLTTYFEDNIGIAMSIGSAGSSIGGLLYTYVARQLLRHPNFQATCLAMGGIMLGTMIPPCVVFKPFPGRASLPTKTVFWNAVKQLEPTFIIMLVSILLTFRGLYCGSYFVNT